MSRVYAASRGTLASLHGTTLTVAAMTAAYVSTDADPDLATITGEVSTGLAPTYVRRTVTGVWNATTGKLSTTPSTVTFDFGSDAASSLVVATAAGVLISEVSLGGSATGNGQTFDLSDAIAATADTDTIRANIANLDVRVTVLESAPPGGDVDPTGSTSGEVLTSTGPATPPVWAAPSGGGASWEQRAGVSGEVMTWKLGGLHKMSWEGSTTPIVTATPGPVMVDTVHVDHQPASPMQCVAFWISGPTSGVLTALIDDATGSELGTPGGVWLQDATGTLGPTDDAYPKLSTIEWWQ